MGLPKSAIAALQSSIQGIKERKSGCGYYLEPLGFRSISSPIYLTYQKHQLWSATINLLNAADFSRGNRNHISELSTSKLRDTTEVRVSLSPTTTSVQNPILRNQNSHDFLLPKWHEDNYSREKAWIPIKLWLLSSHERMFSSLILKLLVPCDRNK